jgi:hypothetical protein
MESLQLANTFKCQDLRFRRVFAGLLCADKWADTGQKHHAHKEFHGTLFPSIGRTVYLLQGAFWLVAPIMIAI